MGLTNIGLYLCLSDCKKIYHFDTCDIGFGRSSCRTTNTFDNLEEIYEKNHVSVYRYELFIGIRWM